MPGEVCIEDNPCIDRYNFYLIKFAESGIILSGTILNA